ncbi:MAG: hypothetical protein IJP37_07575 [Clostridia bacterium]|nr:hypothetical protein [Clostridia bacterium]MBR0027002.1 hypothetical protein [Clostridia bacterium]
MSNTPFFTGSSNTSAPEIDAKDLTILEDQMNAEAMAYRKCTIYSGYFKDPTLSDLAMAAAQHHKQHFSALETYLNSHR